MDRPVSISLESTLTATDVEIKPAGLGVDNIDEAEVEGFVTNLNTAAQTFQVNGQLVDYSTAAFIGGTETELFNGTKVEAEGPIAGGVLQAEKVEFKESIKFEANAATVNVGAGTLTLEDLAGITVVVDDALTEFEPAGSKLSDIVIGNEVKIRAREGSGGDIVAIELEILDQPSDRTIIQGPVTSFVSLGDVTILGVVVVDTTTIKDDDFEDNDIVIGRDEFFNRLAVGDLVKARFRDNVWDQIELED
jgi:ribosomal protein S28E/S33